MLPSEHGVLENIPTVRIDALLPRTKDELDPEHYAKRTSVSGPAAHVADRHLDILGQPKVTYAEGQIVAFDLGQGTRGTGRIRGRIVEDVIDFWIVEVLEAEGINPAMYPWSCLSMPHTLLKPISPRP